MRNAAVVMLVCAIASLISGCELLVYEAKVLSQDAYRKTVPETTTTIEEINTADGKNVVVRFRTDIYSGRYAFSIMPDGFPEWRYEGEYRVSSDGNELPIAFDVINGVPWIVLPVKSNQCASFNYPAEGLVFFRLEGNAWKPAHYNQAPQGLNANLLRNRKEYRDGKGMDRANCEFGSSEFADGYLCRAYKQGRGLLQGGRVVDYPLANSDTRLGAGNVIPFKNNDGEVVIPRFKRHLDSKIFDRYGERYTNKDGSGKTIQEVVDRNLSLPTIGNPESCYFLNPPFDPNERRSLREFVDKEQVVLQAQLTRILDNLVVLDEKAESAVFDKPRRDDSCSSVVNRLFEGRISQRNQAEFAEVSGVPSGMFKSPGTAMRVDLVDKPGNEHKAIYLPQRGFRLAKISAMNCRSGRVLIDFDRDANEIPVLEYDANGTLLNKWRVQLPNGPKEWHEIRSLSIKGDRLELQLFDFERHGYEQGNAFLGRILKQYFYEAKIPNRQ